jgi:hypothetical protein
LLPDSELSVTCASWFIIFYRYLPEEVLMRIGGLTGRQKVLDRGPRCAAREVVGTIWRAMRVWCHLPVAVVVLRGTGASRVRVPGG